MVDSLINAIFNNFDFGYMLAINVLTYLVIKVMDYFNGEAKVPTVAKRLILLISAIAVTGIYLGIGYTNHIVLVNSAILAPVVWSWILKPAFKAMKLDYKNIDNTLGI